MGLLLAPATASAAGAIEFDRVLDATLESPATTAAACHTGARSGPGVVTRTVTVDEPGPLRAELDGAGGDWDLAIYNAAGDAIGASAGAGPDEVVTAVAWAAGPLRVQACRRTGDGDQANVVVEHGEIPDAMVEEARGQKIQAVSVSTPTRADKDRLTSLGLDMTEHGGTESLGVVLHGDEDERKLRAAGFTWEVRNPDLVATGIRDRAVDAQRAARVNRSVFPSGREPVYREIGDYEEELKTLARENPGLVKLIELPHKTYEGRTVYGVEISTDVNVANGKPAFLNMGVHHAREWPAGEHAIEWAYELINGFKRGDARATRIVRESRNIVVPIINPDGFNASRTLSGAPDEGQNEEVPDLIYIVGRPNEYRRKNCRFVDDSDGGNCLQGGFGVAEAGVDPNRNYGGLWGGPGAEGADTTGMTYRGPGPFSEPETKNVKDLVSSNQVVTLITNHTTAGLVLRAPGLASLGDPVDENRGYKALGDAMALENGYFSQKSFELYDTTGTTEDWTYNVAGGFGFTFEIYCGAPNHETGDCDAAAFHPRFATMEKEWDGSSDQSNHVDDPGFHPEDSPFGRAPGYDGKGNREAYYIAAESTLNEQRHAVLEGTAPAGATLRLKKEFATETFGQPQEDGTLKPITFPDKLETTYTVGPDGKFRWHVNPSTRPIVAKATGREARGKPSQPITIANQPPIGTTCGGVLNPIPTTQCIRDHDIDIPGGEGVDNALATFRVAWSREISDYDLEVFRRGEDGNTTGPALASSEIRGTDFDQITLRDLEPGGYVVRVINQTKTNPGVEPYDVTVTFAGPDAPRAGQVEAYTMTCEVGGRVLFSGPVVIDRGEVKQPDLGACSPRAAATAATPPARPAQQPSGPGCTPTNGFRSTRVSGKGRRVELGFTRAQRRPVTVDVFQQSVGRRVIGERLVARYTNKAAGFTWDGKANRRGRKVTDGYYFVRYRMQLGDRRVDVRRTTLRRVNGRFSVRPAFYRRDTCGLLRSYKLTRPVFGGRSNREVSAAYRLNQAGSVAITVTRGSKVVKRFRAVNRQAAQTFRVRLDSEELARGDYKVRIDVRSGAQRETSTLTTRRL